MRSSSIVVCFARLPDGRRASDEALRVVDRGPRFGNSDVEGYELYRSDATFPRQRSTAVLTTMKRSRLLRARAALDRPRTRVRDVVHRARRAEVIVTVSMSSRACATAPRQRGRSSHVVVAGATAHGALPTSPRGQPADVPRPGAADRTVLSKDAELCGSSHPSPLRRHRSAHDLRRRRAP